MTSGGMGGGRPEGPTAASSVADALAAEILEQMKPGTKLPSEAALAERYVVSRLTVREALKMLAGRGLVEVARGRRAVVRAPDGTAFSDFLTATVQYDPKGLFDLAEVRRTLEVLSATLAARRAGRAAIAALEASLEGMRAALEEAGGAADREAAEKRFDEFDIGFHEALAMAGGNRVLSYLFEAMAPTLHESFTISRHGQRTRGHTLEDTVAAHQRILDGVAAGNARAAADAMRAHLESTERDIRSAVSLIGAKG